MTRRETGSMQCWRVDEDGLTEVERRISQLETALRKWRERYECSPSPDGDKLEARVVWQPIETAPKSGYIVVATSWGSRWTFNHVWWNDQVDEWEDVHSDRYIRPHAWAPLPGEGLRRHNPDA